MLIRTYFLFCELEAMEAKVSFEQTIERMAAYLSQVEGVLILIGVTDDTILRDYAIEKLRERVASEIDLRGFRYDPTRLSLFEGAHEVLSSANGQSAVSVIGLEALSRDRQSEAIKLLNRQRNEFGRSSFAVVLWVSHALLSEISVKASDFYSWRSSTFFIEPPDDWDKVASARRSYLQAILHQNEFVNMQGLAPVRAGKIVQMRMDDIFIPLRAEKEVGQEPPPYFPYEIEHEVADGTAASDVEHWRAGLQLRRRSEARMPRFIAEKVAISEVMQKRRAVVLGDPGAGKTTLMRYIAYKLAQAEVEAHSTSEDLPSDLAGFLPVYIRIGEYAQHIKQNAEATLDSFAPLGCQIRQLPLPSYLLEDALNQGRALFLLDGLDEIIDMTSRREVGDRVEKFALAHPQCRVVVTSRIVGYRESKLGSEFSQFTISPFEDDDIKRFAEKWHGALGMPESASSLVNAIKGTPSIRRLATNPLLLTVIALIHYRGTKLPRHRVKLYRLAAETLVDQWMEARRVTPEDWDAKETTDALLPAIAWHLHTTTSSGLVREQDLHDLLLKTMRERDSRLGESEAHAKASQFQRNVAEFSGIFLERGLDKSGRGVYGFLHLTFEEYFTAVRLAEAWQREGDEVLKPLLHHPRWNEIILLAAGHLGEFSQFQASRFAQAILEAGSDYEDILRRDLLMAARCLGDDVRVEPPLRNEIVSKLIDLYFKSDSPESLREDIRKAFSQLVETPAESGVIESLADRLTASYGNVRYAAASALGQMGEAAASERVITRLIDLLSDSDGDVRYAAARALGQMGEAAASERVITRLIDLLSDSEWNVRYAAASALKDVSARIRIAHRSKLEGSFAALARQRDWRDVGYVCLRNLLAAEAA
jgi:hypothetical protein